MRHRWARLAPVLVVLALAACTDGDGAGPSTSTSTSAPTSSTSDGVGTGAGGAGEEGPATSAPVAGAEDWDGVRHDIGIVDRIDRLEDGRTIVVFDRVQLITEDGEKEAAELDEEPIVYGNTDVAFVNENRRLRRYVAAPDVEVLLLANLRETCSDRQDPSAPRWERVTVDAAVDRSLWRDFQQVALTFDGAGRVTRVRFSSSC